MTPQVQSAFMRNLENARFYMLVIPFHVFLGWTTLLQPMLWKGPWRYHSKHSKPFVCGLVATLIGIGLSLNLVSILYSTFNHPEFWVSCLPAVALYISYNLFASYWKDSVWEKWIEIR